MNTEVYKSLQEIYLEKKRSASLFIKEIADVTHRKEITIRKWLCGAAEPDEMTKIVLAQHLDMDVNVLFPPKNS
ncbi:hypothetical protein [Sodaliphilus sp.]|uniref:hypothetical protein n=1 Tax=Sodaliphilus sp. TaxID=2815818 RepID=UPI0038905582